MPNIGPDSHKVAKLTADRKCIPPFEAFEDNTCRFLCFVLNEVLRTKSVTKSIAEKQGPGRIQTKNTQMMFCMKEWSPLNAYPLNPLPHNLDF